MITKSKIFYSNNYFTLIEGDSFKILKKIEAHSVNFVFADPPYFLSGGGISCKGGKQVSVNKGDWDTIMGVDEKLKYHRKWIRLCKNVLDDNGTIMISATFHSVYVIGVALEMEGFSIINNIIWKKTNPAPNLACRSFAHSTETIIWARKIFDNGNKGKHTFNYSEMKTSNSGKQMKDVWEFEEDPIWYESASVNRIEKKEGNHPTQKPLSLLKRIITATTNEGDIVLDPFSGSGTTGIACTLLNRKYVGVEINKEYLEISKKRYINLNKIREL